MMEHTKFGVSVGLVGAAMYLLTCFGGYTSAIILCGYVLLFETNLWLRNCCVKAIALDLVFAFVSGTVGLIPNVLSFIDKMFNTTFSYGLINTIVNNIQFAISILNTALILMLCVKAIKGKTMDIPIVDGLIAKHVKITNVGQ